MEIGNENIKKVYATIKLLFEFFGSSAHIPLHGRIKSYVHKRALLYFLFYRRKYLGGTGAH